MQRKIGIWTCGLAALVLGILVLLEATGYVAAKTVLSFYTGGVLILLGIEVLAVSARRPERGISAAAVFALALLCLGSYAYFFAADSGLMDALREEIGMRHRRMPAQNAHTWMRESLFDEHWGNPEEFEKAEEIEILSPGAQLSLSWEKHISGIEIAAQGAFPSYQLHTSGKTITLELKSNGAPMKVELPQRLRAKVSGAGELTIDAQGAPTPIQLEDIALARCVQPLPEPIFAEGSPGVALPDGSPAYAMTKDVQKAKVILKNVHSLVPPAKKTP